MPTWRLRAFEDGHPPTVDEFALIWNFPFHGPAETPDGERTMKATRAITMNGTSAPTTTHDEPLLTPAELAE